jgi:YebC/PmpR family DNA-binding regulatory protein
MSGHSKWSTIKRSKGVADAKRGQLFTKIGRELAIAAREGGSGDPNSNFRLRLIIDKARQANMPKENIERAIKRGTGELKGAEIEQEIVYEGYGPNGAAILVRVLTDNKNRSASEVRRTFSRHNGALAESGSVAWLFESRGYMSITAEKQSPDDVAMTAIDAGAEDVTPGSESVEVYTKPEDFKWVREALEKRGLAIGEMEPLYMVPKTLMQLEEKDTLQVMSLIDDLEALDDVVTVYSNLDIPESVLEKYEAA